MARREDTTERARSRGYHTGSVDTVISVDDVQRQAQAIAESVDPARLEDLAGAEAFVSIEGLRAGYGKMEILHDFDLRVAEGQSLCLIGPNGAGTSTVQAAISVSELLLFCFYEFDSSLAITS